MIKKIFYALLFVALFLLLALYVIKITNWERYAPWLEQSVQKATGRTLTIKGPIHLGWNKHPVITIENIAFSNADWSAVATTARVKKITLEFHLLPLFKKEIYIVAINIENAQFLVQYNSENVSNWHFEKKNPLLSSGFTLSPLSAPKVSLKNITLTIQPYEGTEKIIVLKTATLLLQPNKKQLATDATGTLNGVGFHVKATITYPKNLESGLYQITIRIGENGPIFSIEL